MQRIAAYADRKLRELALVSRQPDGVVAVLTCMTLSEELLRAEKENLRLRRALEKAERAAARDTETAEQLTLKAEDAHGTAGPGGQ